MDRPKLTRGCHWLRRMQFVYCDWMPCEIDVQALARVLTDPDSSINSLDDVLDSFVETGKISIPRASFSSTLARDDHLNVPYLYDYLHSPAIPRL